MGFAVEDFLEEFGAAPGELGLFGFEIVVKGFFEGDGVVKDGFPEGVVVVGDVIDLGAVDFFFFVAAIGDAVVYEEGGAVLGVLGAKVFAREFVEHELGEGEGEGDGGEARGKVEGVIFVQAGEGDFDGDAVTGEVLLGLFASAWLVLFGETLCGEDFACGVPRVGVDDEVEVSVAALKAGTVGDDGAAGIDGDAAEHAEGDVFFGGGGDEGGAEGYEFGCGHWRLDD